MLGMITINNLSKSYGTRVLFDNLSFSVGKNEKIGLVGRNGQGKTTLLKMIVGEAEYDSGEIQIPKNLTNEEIELYKKLQEISSGSVREV